MKTYYEKIWIENMKQFLNWTLKHILKTSSTFSGNQLKKEITGTAIGMELPPDHALRVALQDQKSKFEALFERFFNSITGIGWMSNPLMNSDLKSGMFFAKSKHVIWIIFSWTSNAQAAHLRWWQSGCPDGRLRCSGQVVISRDGTNKTYDNHKEWILIIYVS